MSPDFSVDCTIFLTCSRLRREKSRDIVYKLEIYMNLPYPILEYDPARMAMIEPSLVIKRRDVPEHCVVCFFKEVIEKVAVGDNAKGGVDKNRGGGPHRVYEIMVAGDRRGFFYSCRGSGAAPGVPEENISF